MELTPNYPPIEQQIRELVAAGWKKETRYIWRAPDGRIFIGPHGAWKHLHSLPPISCGHPKSAED